MSKPFYVKLNDRGLVMIEGPDRAAFLQGLVTNDVSGMQDGDIRYACLLTPQGKFLHDFFICAAGETLMLDCEGGARAQDLHDRLLKFRLRSKISLSVETNHNVFVLFGGSGGWPDPRHEKLGRRVFTAPDNMEQNPFADWDRIRIELTVPDGSRDMEIEKSTLLECGIDKLNGIDWNKGCYMGQELTARMKYRGLAKKHLHTVKIQGVAPPPFADLPNGGSMRSSCGDIGLALMKDDDVREVLSWP